MAGKFTIKRRLAASPRPDGQSSQQGVLQALGIGVGRSSPHTGSKRGYVHLSDPGPEARFEAAQRWSAATGRPLPPHMRPRRPLDEPTAMWTRQRFAAYAGREDDRPVEKLLAEPLASAQRRRLLRKAGQHGELPAGSARAPQPRAKRPSASKARRARQRAKRAAARPARVAAP